jgi:hypothetical protein
VDVRVVIELIGRDGDAIDECDRITPAVAAERLRQRLALARPAARR